LANWIGGDIATISLVLVEDEVMAKRTETGLRILDENQLDARVCRVADLLRGVCQRELWFRVENRSIGWCITFFESKRDAMRDSNPLTWIPVGYGDMVASAFNKAHSIEIEYTDEERLA
jgi:hypothetical protein